MADRYPHIPGARSGSPRTSFAAAESMKEIANSIRNRVHNVVIAAGERGVIGDDVAEALGLHVTQVRSRLSELHADGKIVDSGRERTGASGRKGAVWVLPRYAPPPPADPQGDLLVVPHGKCA
ncbi:hypothetical protein [Novosphingobium olei]|uniref:Uncharacterized protein n=1 Tax=Novosphingobium olei TaxID=2728851 RepID=A0A7Y0BRK2_9SPHN|nr:hypothetical protein [Novosphingobium olei]NML95148.1 hypothetical protein [Novosphingobium olei]